MQSQSISTTLQKGHVFLLVLLTLVMALPGLANLLVIDRDEARYAQATVQMVESGDYLNIRFQDRARNKKPAGIYWMQAASVKALTDPPERKIWAHRIPSVFGALLGVLATYWAGLHMLGRRGAIIAGAVLGTSALFVFEAHIAKTDAMLCGLSALVLSCMIRLRTAPYKFIAFVFWAALAAAVMIKGPITPALVGLTLITLGAWEREWRWMRRLLSLPGIAAAILIVLPWSYLIWQATDGAFFRDAIGGDLAPKIAGGQEKHGALPGYYLLTLPILFWPGTLILIAGFANGFARAFRRSKNPDGHLFRLLLCWMIPFWIILELVPTKLPNYLLPVYPALALLCAAAALKLFETENFRKSRWAGFGLFLIIGLLLCAAAYSAEQIYGSWSAITLAGCILSVMAILASAYFFIREKFQKAAGGTLISVIVLSGLIYQHILPRAEELRVSYKIESAFYDENILLPRRGGPRVFSPQYTEPSLVYLLGTDIILGDKIDKNEYALANGDILILDQSRPDYAGLMQKLSERFAISGNCLIEKKLIQGINYSKGDPVELQIFEAVPCVSP